MRRSRKEIYTTHAVKTPDWIDTHRAAEILGTSESTLKQWRAKPNGNGLRFFRVGSRVKYSEAQVWAYLHNGMNRHAE